MSASARPPWLRALDAASIVVCAALALRLARAPDALPPLEWLPALALVAGLGWALADLVSGAVHWLGDTFFDEATPLLGPSLIRPFREHHADPSAITRHGALELTGNNALFVCPLLAAATPLAASFGEEAASTLASTALVSLSGGLLATNQIHAWAHTPAAGRLARALRWLGLAITPEAHARHHASAHDRAYCITTGWWNPLLDRTRTFARIELAVRRLAPRTRAAAGRDGSAG